MKRLVVGVAVVLAVVLVALTVRDLPHSRGVTLARPAPAEARITSVIEELRAVRAIAVPQRDAKPLSTVEGGAKLEIDTGALRVAAILDTDIETFAGDFHLIEAHRPLFSVYPLWFAATVRDTDTKRTFVQVFERTTAADPWLLVASPEVVHAESLPEIERVDGLVDRVAAPEGLGQRYVAALRGDETALTDDAFVSEQRTGEQVYAALEDVEFSRTWEAEPVRQTMLTRDGGALVFLTLRRTDRFEVEPGLSVTWPVDSPAQAFWSGGITGTGALEHAHQLLVHVPGNGGTPRTIGVSGGPTGTQ